MSDERIEESLHEARKLMGLAINVSFAEEAAIKVQTAHVLATVRVAEALERNNQLIEESLNRNFPERGQVH